jgi:hypothetical protein
MRATKEDIKREIILFVQEGSGYEINDCEVVGEFVDSLSEMELYIKLENAFYSIPSNIEEKVRLEGKTLEELTTAIFDLQQPNRVI